MITERAVSRVVRRSAFSAWAAVALVLTCLGALQALPGLTWHDQQRVLQIVLATMAFVALLSMGGRVCWQREHLLSAGALFLLSMISVSRAAYPDRALAEYALLVCSIGIGAWVYVARTRQPVLLDRFLGGAIRILLLGTALQFYVLFLAALAQPELYFSLNNLFPGFSNPRHQGQFLTLVVPLLLVSLPIFGEARRWPYLADVFALVSVVAGVILVGTRGTVAAWLAVSGVFLLLGGGARRIASKMLLALLAGFLLAGGLLEILNLQFSEAMRLRFTGSEVLGLSSRERLWWPALEGIRQSPWFGIGPMHFAATENQVATHPHQAILQLSLEWGMAATGIILFCVGRWFWRGIGVARLQDERQEGNLLTWALLFSVGASAVQSMVDGVLVMPYPQIWLAIIVGWASAYLYSAKTAGVSFSAAVPMLLLGTAVLFLLMTLAVDYPLLLGAAEYCGGGPRFWCNGRIP